MVAKRIRSEKKQTPEAKEEVEGDVVALPDRFPIVGIGASAGGLQAFEEFFQHMSGDSGMAFVVVSHLDPDRASMLPELLGKSTSMPVRQVTDGAKVEPNRVYVSPPGKDLAILRGVLQLMNTRDTHATRLPIDYWFRSLAQDQKEKAVCIVLSGNGSDGTLGLKAIKGESGLALVQDPESAKFPGMPSSAIATRAVDFVLPPREMPKQLLNYTRGAYLKTSETELELTGTALPAFQKILVLLRIRTAHDFSQYKTTTIQRRVARRINILQIDSYKHYVQYLEQNPQEVDLLFSELLIGVTSFFRENDAFEALARNGLPDLFESRTEDSPLRVWVPGCSTGEEAFSLAMLLREAMESKKKHFEVQVFATDLDTRAIETARTGLYPAGIASDLSPARLRRFFSRDNDHYQIKKEIRDRVVFAVQNLIKDPPFTKLDLLSCRNLLIYLQADLQKRLMPMFHYALKPDGLLFLGSSETLGSFSDLFQVLDKKGKVFKRREGQTSLRAPGIFPLVGPLVKDSQVVPPAEPYTDYRSNISELACTLLSERYAPPSVIVNERGDIVYFHGQTGLYLQPATGKPSHNVFAMARERLQFELAPALRKALSQDEEIIRKGVRVNANDSVVCVDLQVSKIDTPEALRGLFMITFHDTDKLEPAASEETLPGESEKHSGDLTGLERELKYTKENLQSTIEELETSNEEMRSTNEELQSTNEELQSANEELQTSREEMESLNEELQTVNAEVQGKIGDLSQVNDDMTNLLNSTEIATVFLDDKLQIKRFTKQATEIFRLIQSDVGRPIADIVSNLEYSDLEEDARQVLTTLTFVEKELQAQHGVWYLMRIVPYRTAENVIDGLVLTFVNIAELKKAQEEATQAHEFAESIVRTIHEPLLVLDGDMRITKASASFYKTFSVIPEETEGRCLFELGNSQWDIPELRSLLAEILPQQTSFEGFEVDHVFPSLGRRKMLLNARRLEYGSEGKQMILLAIQDVNEKDVSPSG